jgi:hypothetical protein
MSPQATRVLAVAACCLFWAGVGFLLATFL